MQIHKRKYTNTVLHADRVTHAARYMRLTKGDKVKHMFLSLDAIHFEELFTLGLIHFARYMRLTKGDKVKHMFGCQTLWGVVHSGMNTLRSLHETNQGG